MLMTLVVLALAVNGGLYVGTIAYSAYKSEEQMKAMAFFQKSGAVHIM